MSGQETPDGAIQRGQSDAQQGKLPVDTQQTPPPIADAYKIGYEGEKK
jgi:hypothetical protein